MNDSKQAAYDWRDDVDKMHAHDRAVAAGTHCQCGHGWEVHTKRDGCYAGWEYDKRGIGHVDGCKCQLAHAHLSPADDSGVLS